MKKLRLQADQKASEARRAKNRRAKAYSSVRRCAAIEPNEAYEAFFISLLIGEFAREQEGDRQLQSIHHAHGVVDSRLKMVPRFDHDVFDADGL